MDVGTLRQALSVLLVFLLLGFALWKLRQPGSGRSLTWRPPWRRPAAAGRSLQAVERLALTPQHMLHLVRVDGRELVVATHPQGCSFMESRALLFEGNGLSRREGGEA